MVKSKYYNQFNIKTNNDFDIISADSEFYRYVINNNIKNLLILLSDEDKNKLKNAICKQNLYENVSIVVDILIDNIAEPSLMNITREDNDLLFSIYNVAEVSGIMKRLEFLNKRKNYLLSMFDINYFVLDIRQKSMIFSSTQIEGNIDEISLGDVKNKLVRLFHLSGEENLDTLDKFYKYIQNPTPTGSVTYTFNTPKGENTIKVLPIPDAYGVPSHLIGTFTLDDSSIKIYEDLYQHVDAATNLLNKNTIIDYAKNKVDVLNQPTSLIIVDIDNFKTINDTYGHAFGDQVIYKIAKELKKIVGSFGKVGRFGGDEFLIVIDNITDEQKIRNLARSIRLAVQWLFAEEKKELIVTCSMGISRYPVNKSNYRALFDLADKCLYLAKKKGKNKYIIYIPELHENVINDIDLDAPSHSESMFKIAEQRSEILALISHGGSRFTEGLDLVLKYLYLDRINIYNDKFDITAHAGEASAFRKKLINSDKYFSHFNRDNIFINTNYCNLYGLDNEIWSIYKKHGVTASFEYLLVKDNKVLGLISFDMSGTMGFDEKEIEFLYLLAISLKKIYFKEV